MTTIVDTRPLVHTAILLPHQRLIRQPLPQWATALDVTVRRVLADAISENGGPSIGIVRQIVACFNEAALVETYFGRRDRAASLCRGALDWIAAARRVTSSDAVCETAFQPYVNLGRLARIERRWNDSLDAFRTVRDALNGHATTIGPIELGEPALAEALRDADVRRSLDHMYVIDSLKTLLKAEWCDAAIAFVRGEQTPLDQTTRRQSLREGLTIALCGAGRYAEAAEIAERELAEPNTPHRALFVFRRAEALAGAGSVDAARQLAQGLAASFQANQRALGQNQLSLLLAVVPLARRLGIDAEPLAALGLESARRLGDVLLRGQWLDLLGTWPAREESRHGYARERQEVNRESWYGTAATAGASEDGRRLIELMDATFARLMASSPVSHHQRTPTPSGIERFRAAPLVGAGGLGSSELVYLPLRKTSHVLPAGDVRLARACDRFEPLAAHAERLMRGRGAAVSRETVERRLSALAELGALVSETDILRSCVPAPAEDSAAPARIAWLAIPTCDRPDALRRALDSYLAHADARDRRISVLIADGASTVEARDRCQAMLIRCGRDHPATSFVHYDAGERQRLAQRLLDTDELPPDTVEFALFGGSYLGTRTGCNRNAMLLRTVGDLVLSVDDDTVCRVSQVGEGVDLGRVIFREHDDVTDVWSFETRDAACEFVAPADVDLFAEHERFLGRAPGSCIRADQTVDVERACTHLIASLYNGTGRIYATYNGLVGDSATYSTLEFGNSPSAASRRRLLASESTYGRAVGSREVVRQVLSPTICHGGLSMSAFVGLDNRELLPPFIPVYWNEDGVFGAMLANSIDGGYAAHLPFALLHAPPTSTAAWRSWHPGAALAEWRPAVRVCDVIMAFMMGWRGEHTRDRRGRLQSLGRHFTEIGSLQADEFQEALRMFLWARALDALSRQERLLREDGEAPAFWIDMLKQRMQRLLEAAAQPDYLLPSDLLAHYQPELVPAVLQRFIRQFGDLVGWWPAIVERARRTAV
jgi:hypothetical protein